VHIFLIGLEQKSRGTALIVAQNLWPAPSTEFSSTKPLSVGDTVTILASIKMSNGDFYYIQAGSNKGFVLKSNVAAAIYYKTLSINSATQTLANQATNDAEGIFWSKWKIYLVRQSSSTTDSLEPRSPACTKDVCDILCGGPTCYVPDGVPFLKSHHKSAQHLLLKNFTQAPPFVFSFVDFRLCTDYENRVPPHDEVYGLSDGAGKKNMITSLATDHGKRTTVHEISHLFGAKDEVCTPDTPCVMSYDPLYKDVRNVWCNNCSSYINAYLKTINY